MFNKRHVFVFDRNNQLMFQRNTFRKLEYKTLDIVIKTFENAKISPRTSESLERSSRWRQKIGGPKILFELPKSSRYRGSSYRADFNPNELVMSKGLGKRSRYTKVRDIKYSRSRESKVAKYSGVAKIFHFKD